MCLQYANVIHCTVPVYPSFVVMVLKIFQFSVIRILHPGLPLCVGEGECDKKGGGTKNNEKYAQIMLMRVSMHL